MLKSCFLVQFALSFIQFNGLSQTCPLKISLVSDTVACRLEFPPPRGSASPTQFSVKLKVLSGFPTSIVWSNGDVGSTLRPIESGTYEVIVLDLSGCTVSAKVQVEEFGLDNLEAGLSASNFCLGDTTEFIGIPTSEIDKFMWFFGDGESSTIPNPKKYFNSSGHYISSLRLTNRCGLDTTLIKQINILTKPPKPTIPGSSVLCDNSITLDANKNGLSGLTYLWSSGETSKAIIVSDPSIISVTNTNSSGCSSSSTTFIVDNRPDVNLGQDISICQYDNLVLSSLNPGSAYEWRINHALSGNTLMTQPINSSTQGVFIYSVKVTDPITTCFGIDSVQVTILSRPDINLGQNVSICQYDNLVLSALNPGSTYEWRINNALSENKLMTQPINSSTQGVFVYSVKVTNPITNCFGISSVQVTILGRPDINLGQDATICQYDNLALSALNPGSTYEWRINNALSENKLMIQPINSSTQGVFVYSVKVTDPITNCFGIDSVRVTVLETPEKPIISLEGLYTLHSSSDFGNQWYKNGIIIPEETNQDLIVKESGNYTVQVLLNQCIGGISDPFTYSVTSLTDLSIKTNSLQFFPNPTRDLVYIESTSNQFFTVVIYNKFGQEVKNQKIQSGEFIDLTELPIGVYLFKSNGFSKKLIKF
jgi:PKD repeat protein